MDSLSLRLRPGSALEINRAVIHYRPFESTPMKDQNKNTAYWRCSCFGGRWWIRTTEGEASRFTVCPLWPLGKSPMYGAGVRNRTINLLITNQLLCLLSYTSILSIHQRNNDYSRYSGKCQYLFFLFLSFLAACRYGIMKKTITGVFHAFSSYYKKRNARPRLG